MQNFIILLLSLLYYRLIYYFIIYKYICVRLYFEFLQKYFGFAGGGEREREEMCLVRRLCLPWGRGWLDHPVKRRAK